MQFPGLKALAIIMVATLAGCVLPSPQAEKSVEQDVETVKAMTRLCRSYVVTDSTATPLKLSAFDLQCDTSTIGRAQLTIVREDGGALLDQEEVSCAWSAKEKGLVCTNDAKTYSIYLTEAQNLSLPAQMALNSYYFKVFNWGDTHHFDEYLAKVSQ
jgi:hypothetical protein